MIRMKKKIYVHWITLTSIHLSQNMGQRKKKRRQWMIWGRIWLMRELEWNRALLTMALISGADVSMPALEPQEDIFKYSS